jgi:ABC-type multidrug transport system fused ATPase/permease subunit
MTGRHSLARLLVICRPEAALATVAVVLALAAAAAALAIPWRARSLIDQLAARGGSGDVDRAFLVLAALWAASGFISLARDLAVSRLGHRVVAILRSRVVAHVLRLPVGYFDHARSGDLVSRLTTDIENLRRTVAEDAVRAVGDTALVLGASILLLTLAPGLTLALMSAVAVLPLVHRVLSPLLKSMHRRAQDGLAATISRVSEAFSNVRLVKSQARELYETRRASEGFGQVAVLAYRADRIQSLAWRVLYSGLGLLGLAVLWYLSKGIRAGGATLGTAIAYLYTLMIAAAPVISLAGIAGRAQRAGAAADRITEALDEPLEPEDAPGMAELNVSAGAVVFDRVSFEYSDGRPVLSEFSLRVPAGGTTAIVGATGAGKSTVAALLQRFYEPSSGRISIDGVWIDSVTSASVRAALAVVTQETLLFDASIRENIRYGRLEASDRDVEDAAAAAHVMEFAAKMARGLDTPIGEKGVVLSGGQRQTIAIARALLREAPIFLLDEATSSLDRESEAFVQDAFRKLMAGRTTLVIAHRLQTVREADLIAVLDRGSVVAAGTHDTLVMGCERYRELFGLPGPGFDPPGPSP